MILELVVLSRRFRLRPKGTRTGRERRCRARSGMALVCCGLLWTSADAVSGQDIPLLRLTEIGSHPLPHPVPPSGASLSGHGSVVLWWQNQPDLLLIGTNGLEELVPARRMSPVSVAFVSGDSILEAIDGSSSRLVRFDRAGRIRWSAPLNQPWEIDSAVRTGSTWVLCGTSRAGDAELSFVTTSASAAVTVQVISMFAATCERVHFAPGPDESVLVSELSSPYRVGVISPGRVPGDSWRFPDRQSTRAETDGMWVALPLLALDDGYVQVLADLRGDERVISVFSRDLALLRQNRLRVPMGFLASSVGQRSIAAVRRLNVLELVLYRWGWDPRPSAMSNK